MPKYGFLYNQLIGRSYIPNGDYEPNGDYIPNGDNGNEPPGDPLPSYWWVWPALSTVISGFKYTDSHHALDIAASLGSPIMAPTQGKVIKTGWDPDGYGNYVMIETAKEGYKVILAHLSEFAVKVGDLVDPGDVVGKAGSTGRSTGPHLHFEIRTAGGGGFINPFDIFGSSPSPGKPVYGTGPGWKPGTEPSSPGQGPRRPGDTGSGSFQEGEGWIINTPLGEIVLPDLFPDFDPVDILVVIIGLVILFIGIGGLVWSEVGDKVKDVAGVAVKAAI